MDITGKDTITCNRDEPTNINGKIDFDNSSNADKVKTVKGKLCLFLTNNALLLFTLLGVIVGFSLGFGLRKYDLTDSGLMWLGKGATI